MTTLARPSPAVLFTLAPSPLGPLALTWSAGRLTGLHLEGRTHLPPESEAWVEDAGPFAAALAQLEAYFAGELRRFDLPLSLPGTPFRQKVWQALREIPYGETISYAELARRVGHPYACRAVGTANGHNPIAVIVPCHRVIAADGTLGGYGGGLERKAWLLRHEFDVLRLSAQP